MRERAPPRMLDSDDSNVPRNRRLARHGQLVHQIHRWLGSPAATVEATDRRIKSKSLLLGDECCLEACYISELDFQPKGKTCTRTRLTVGGIAVVILVADRPLGKSRPVSKSIPTLPTVLALSELRALAGTAIPGLHKKKLKLRPFPRYSSLPSLPAIIIKCTHYLYNGLEIKA